MNISKGQIFCFIVLYCFALGIYIYGFVPRSTFSNNLFKKYNWKDNCLEFLNNEKSCVELSRKSYTRKFDRLVLIVIDALRADFIPSIVKSDFNVSLPFIENLLHKKYAISFINKVFSPTVTLPRIKTLMTGRTSSFIDLISNFNAGELNEDNFLNQANSNGLKSIFYGDDTWLKVFPKIFLRSEGTHSFYVRDFTEVDNNVTRHLKSELSLKDWDIMVLHYLGVDHIGHGYSPYSPYLSSKLKEMDLIIKFIHNQLKENSDKKPSLIVICGDHGMTAEGNHGGITKSETLTPLIFINTNNSKYISSSNNKVVSQIDIAVTLSVLLGLPLPKSNTGAVIMDVLHYSGMQSHEILNILLFNVLQLYQLQKELSSYDKYLFQSIQEVLKLHLKELEIIGNENHKLNYFILEKYSLLLSKLTKLHHHDSSFDNLLLVSGLSIMWVCVIWLVVCLLAWKNPPLISEVIHFCLNRFTTKLYISAIIASVILYFYNIDCAFLITVYTVFSLSVFTLFLLIWIIIYVYKNFFVTYLEKLFLLPFALHSLSLFSSSFIEKEHYTWYFIITSLYILLTIRMMCNAFNATVKHCKQSNIVELFKVFINQKKNYKFDVSAFLLLSLYVLQNYGLNNNSKTNIFIQAEEYFQPQALIFNFILIIYIFSKRQKNELGLLTFTAFISGSLFNHFYKSLSDELLIIILERFNLNLSMIIPWIIYVHVLFIIFSSLQNLIMDHSLSVWDKNILFITDITEAWILLTNLIGKNHLIFFSTIILLQEIYLSQITWEESYRMLFKICFYLQFSSYSFFCQGNSNSLSTIDVSSGYVGLPFYQPVLVGILIICNTYRSLILWLLLLFYRMLCFLSKDEAILISTKYSEIYYFLAIVVYRLFILSVYCIVMFLMKYHLFIMSVFAPKFFYEIANVAVYLVCFLFLTVCQYLCKLLK